MSRRGHHSRTNTFKLALAAGVVLALTGCIDGIVYGPRCTQYDRLKWVVGAPDDDFPQMPSDPPFSLATATVTRLDTNETEVSNRAFRADDEGRLVAEGCLEQWYGWRCSLLAPAYGSCARSGDWRVELVFDADVPVTTFEFTDGESVAACPWPEVCFGVSTF